MTIQIQRRLKVVDSAPHYGIDVPSQDQNNLYWASVDQGRLSWSVCSLASQAVPGGRGDILLE